jgi:hypothetical protein
VANGLSIAEDIQLKSDFDGSSSSAEFTVYPNPSTGRFQISAGEMAGNITISDVSGNIILKQELNGNTGIDMVDFPRGMYILRLSTPTAVHTKKLLLN